MVIFALAQTGKPSKIKVGKWIDETISGAKEIDFFPIQLPPKQNTTPVHTTANGGHGYQHTWF